ncbi:MAG: diphthamide biosynthesis enzyme Dph2 [Candidatus Thermoplasmatota archaeon]|nr:diphthamide biosynthesis enzyme Dph2 [Candidatus Thermoplasmatota archaeon]
MTLGPDMGSFKLDIDPILALILRNSYGSVMLQVPEGLKRYLPQIARFIEQRTGVEVILDGDVCYGACDHPGDNASMLGCDAIIHLGHEDIPTMERGHVPIHFFRVSMNDTGGGLEKGIELFSRQFKGNRIGLVTTTQHLGLIDRARVLLEAYGSEVVIGEPGKREAFPGQVLGCSFQSAREVSPGSDAVLYLGTGRFHPLGIALSLGREVHCIDPMTGDHTKVGMDEVEAFLRKRFARIARAQNLLHDEKETVVVLSVKPGQRRIRLARELAALAKDKGIDAYLVSMDLLDPMKVRSFGFKVAVSTACPRIVVDEDERYGEEGVTLLSPIEFRISVGIQTMEDYHLDEEW